MNKHACAIKANDKVLENLPIKYCLACERLCCSSDLHQVSRLRKVPDNEAWKNILGYAQAQNITATHICQFCLRKVRAKDEVPSIAALNNLQVHPVPSEIADLNVYEIVFIHIMFNYSRPGHHELRITSIWDHMEFIRIHSEEISCCDLTVQN